MKDLLPHGSGRKDGGKAWETWTPSYCASGAEQNAYLPRRCLKMVKQEDDGPDHAQPFSHSHPRISKKQQQDTLG